VDEKLEKLSTCGLRSEMEYGRPFELGGFWIRTGGIELLGGGNISILCGILKRRATSVVSK
jgi:hypothetical protein